MKIYIANRTEDFKFSLNQYLAQRFPPLIPRPVTSVEEQCRWNADELGDLGGDSGFLNSKLFQSQVSSSIELAENQTIKAALSQFDDWIKATLQEHLPKSAVAALSKWLERQWNLYLSKASSQIDWEGYFWKYMSMLGSNALEVHGAMQTISPLVGHVEVHPVGVKCFEGEFEANWRYEEYIRDDGGDLSPKFHPASLSDPLGVAFAHRIDVCTVDGKYQTDSQNRPVKNWTPMDQPWRWPQFDFATDGVIRNEEGEVVFEDYDGYTLCLVVRYRGASLSTNFLKQNNVFYSFASALHPRDHWAVRYGEVVTSQAERMMSSTLPTCIRQSVQSKFQQPFWSLGRIAASINNLRIPLRDSIWLDPAVQQAVLRESRREREAQRAGRQYNFAECYFLSEIFDDNPLAPDNHGFSDEPEETDEDESASSISRLLGIENWQEGYLLPFELYGILKRLRSARQHEILDRHLEVVGLIEMAIRQLLKGRSSGRTQIDLAFSAWLATQDGRTSKTRYGDDTHSWRGPINSHLFWDNKPFRAKNISSNLSLASFARLSDRISQVITDAESQATAIGINKLGVPLKALLQVPTDMTGTHSWNEHLFAMSERTEKGFGNLLFAAKLIFQIRNLLIHGVPFESQPETDHEIAIANYESKIALMLDVNSLEQCFRLVTACITAIVRHDSYPQNDEQEYLLNVVASSGTS